MVWDYGVHTEINCQVSLIHCGLVWHMVSEIVAITGSSNGFSPVYCQVIAWISSDLLSIGPTETNLNSNKKSKQKNLVHENAIENVVCKALAIMSSDDFSYWLSP